MKRSIVKVHRPPLEYVTIGVDSVNISLQVHLHQKLSCRLIITRTGVLQFKNSELLIFIFVGNNMMALVVNMLYDI